MLLWKSWKNLPCLIDERKMKCKGSIVRNSMSEHTPHTPGLVRLIDQLVCNTRVDIYDSSRGHPLITLHSNQSDHSHQLITSITNHLNVHRFV